jgi:hypothetical protein
VRKEKMKKNKIGTLFLVSALALAGIGISYAGFTDTIYVYGTAETGTVEWCVVDYSSTEIWKVWGDDIAPNNEMVRIKDFNPDDIYPIDWAIDNFGGIFDEPDFPNTELVAFAYAQPCFDSGVTTQDVVDDPCGKCVRVDFVNMFPCVDFTVDFVVHYQGTIPGKILDFVVDTDVDNGENFKGTDMNWLEYLWWLGMDGNNANQYPEDPMKDTYGIFVNAYVAEPDGNGGWTWDTDKPVTPGYQLHACNYTYVEITIHIPQDNDFQGLSGAFNVDLMVKQWNEVDNQGNVITG